VRRRQAADAGADHRHPHLLHRRPS
jgi:hypothetical protein